MFSLHATINSHYNPHVVSASWDHADLTRVHYGLAIYIIELVSHNPNFKDVFFKN